MVYLNHEVAAQSDPVPEVKKPALSKAYDAYATPRPQNLQFQRNRQTTSPQVNARANRNENGNGDVKPIASSAAEAAAAAAKEAEAVPLPLPLPLPQLYNHHVPSSQAPTTKPLASTTFKQLRQERQQETAQAMYVRNVSPRPYVSPPNTHMDLSNFHSRPLYSTKDLAFQPINDGTTYGPPLISGLGVDGIDAGQVNENMKALLEGAIGDNDEDAYDREEGSIESLSVRLLPHQLDGLAWMLEKEMGRKKKNGALPMGGILADDMGLGKTIQAIALMLRNPRPAKDAKLGSKEKPMPEEVSASTLVIAPLALIKQWESEIKTKVASSHRLRVLVHHGSNRTKSARELMRYDVVITTYQTVMSEHIPRGKENSEYANSEGGSGAGCHGVHWYRIILDEAHSIKNRNAKSSQACYALRSQYRWCLTGTPMQNNLDELQSLIRFLRIKPYDNLQNWREQIIEPMKRRRGGLAMRRLQLFLRAIMKRRTKDVLKQEGALTFGGKAALEKGKEARFNIVERKVETITVDFSQVERKFYDRLANKAESRIDRMIKNQKIDSISALVLLLRLRQSCNHPQLTRAGASKDGDTTVGGGAAAGKKASQFSSKAGSVNGDIGEGVEVEDVASLLGGLTVTAKQCDICKADLTDGEIQSGMIRCEDCEDNLVLVRRLRYPEYERTIKKSSKRRTNKDVADISSQMQKLSTNCSGSDSEEQGEWIVPQKQRSKAKFGRAGGSEDENADGGGQWLGSDDSTTDGDDEDDEDDNDQSVYDSFHSSREPRSLGNKDGSGAVQRIEVSDDEDNESSSESDVDNAYKYTGEVELLPSAKIRALLRILAKETKKHKVIVFSVFTSMLDIIEPILDDNGIVSTRYDGKLRNDVREANLNKLRNDKATRVLLCSLNCGSLGLNLTAASRVVILEPFWNPFVEEQAIDRVHRLNQTVDVVVYKLIVHDTVEARILELQESKRKLANAAIEGAKGANNKLTMKDMMKLFRREAEYDHRDAIKDESAATAAVGEVRKKILGRASSSQERSQALGQEGDVHGSNRSQTRRQSDIQAMCRDLLQGKMERKASREHKSGWAAEDAVYGRR